MLRCFLYLFHWVKCLRICAEGVTAVENIVVGDTRPNEFGSMTAREDDMKNMQFKAIKDHTRPSKAIQGHTRPYKPIQAHTRTHNAMLILMMPHIVMALKCNIKTIRGHIRPCKAR